MIKAPWTAKQIQNLEARQIRFGLHPYTCGNCSGQGETTDLIPHRDGWYCPRCDFMVQDWAHSSDVTGEFHKLADFRQRLNDEIDASLEGL